MEVPADGLLHQHTSRSLSIYYVKGQLRGQLRGKIEVVWPQVYVSIFDNIIPISFNSIKYCT